MNNRSKFLLKNVSVFTVGELGTKLINYILVPFYTYALTTAEYGTVDLLFTICMIIIPLVMFNIGEAIMRYALDKDADCTKLMNIAIVAIVFGMIVGLLIIPITSWIELLSEYSYTIYFYVIASATKSIITSFLRGREQLKLYVVCNLTNTALIAAFNILFLAQLHWGVKGYLRAYILADFATICIAFICGKLYQYFSHWSFDKELVRKMVGFSLAIIPNSLLWWVINASDRLMVTYMCGVDENGILSVAYKIPSLITTVSTVLMQAWKYSAIKEDDSVDKNEYTNSMYNSFFHGLILVSAGLVLLIRPLTTLLYADAYHSSWQASAYLLLGFVFMGAATFVGTVYYVKKSMVGNLLSALCGAIVNILFNILLIPYMGAAGATLAATVAYFSIFLYRYFDTRKWQKIRAFDIKKIAVVFIICTMIVIENIMNQYEIPLLILCFTAICVIEIKYIKQLLIFVISAVRSTYSLKHKKEKK